MKKATLIILLAVIVALALPAFADNTCSGNDSASWSISQAPAAINPGGTTSAGVNMTSPSCLQGPLPGPGGTANLYINQIDFSSYCDTSNVCTPDIPNPSVLPTVTVTNNPQTYSGTGQTQTYNLSIDGNGAPAGTYTFHVHANASTDGDGNGNNDGDYDNDDLGGPGVGWGFASGVDLVIVVTPEQNACDGDSVTAGIKAPTSGSNINFCNGGTPIPVDVTGVSSKSTITSLTAAIDSVNVSLSLTGIGTASAEGTGTGSVGSVGQHGISATANDACGNSDTATENFGVVYVFSGNGLQPPLAGGTRPKGGSDAPIKLIPRDCNGNIVPFDSTVEIKIYRGTGANKTLLQDSTFGGCTGSNCGLGADTTVRYDSTTGQYITNFQTAAGANTYTIEFYFGGFLNFTTTFSTKA